MVMSETGLPLVEELRSCPDVLAALGAVADLPGVILLESALRREHVGRFSFLAADPFDRIIVDRVKFGDEPLADLRMRLGQFPAAALPELPPFQGGAAGLSSYELGRAWERIPA